MLHRVARVAIHLAVAIALCAGGLPATTAAAKPLDVVATVPDLGSLARAVGGDDVSVTVFVKGPQDPHFIEPRPSFIRTLHDADLFIQMGMDLEAGWVPVLLRSARNRDVQPGGRGYLDASTVIEPLEVPVAPVDRSMGDVHPFGNPHYLSDPANGLRVAALIRDGLIALRPESAAQFQARYAAFATALVEALVGPRAAAGLGVDRVAHAALTGRLAAVLEPLGAGELGGWLGSFRAGPGTKAVQDHRLWPYFARRFGLELAETLEPRPGIPPTTRHLSAVVERMQAENIGLVLASPYADPRYSRWIAERTGARVAAMAHQVGARKGTDDYLALIDYNVTELLGRR